MNWDFGIKPFKFTSLDSTTSFEWQGVDYELDLSDTEEVIWEYKQPAYYRKIITAGIYFNPVLTIWDCTFQDYENLQRFLSDDVLFYPHADNLNFKIRVRVTSFKPLFVDNNPSVIGIEIKMKGTHSTGFSGIPAVESWGVDFAYNYNKTTKILQLTNLSYGINSYLWAITPAAGWSYTAGTNETSANPSILFSAFGDYTITLTGTKNGQGSRQILKTITIADPSIPALPPLTNPNSVVVLDIAGIGVALPPLTNANGVIVLDRADIIVLSPQDTPNGVICLDIYEAAIISPLSNGNGITCLDIYEAATVAPLSNGNGIIALDIYEVTTVAPISNSNGIAAIDIYEVTTVAPIDNSNAIIALDIYQTTIVAPISNVNCITSMDAVAVWPLVPTTNSTCIAIMDIIQVASNGTWNSTLKGSNIVINDKTVSSTGTIWQTITADLVHAKTATTGGYYFEILTGGSGRDMAVGVQTQAGFVADVILGNGSDGGACWMSAAQGFYYNRTGEGIANGFFDPPNVVGVGFDFATKTISFYRNQTLMFSRTVSLINPTNLLPAVSIKNTTATMTARFTAATLSWVPTGFSAWSL